MPLRIPTSIDPKLPVYRQITGLDGREYVFDFHWNQRSGFWYVSIADQDGAPIANGLSIGVNWPLNLGLVDPRLPAGSFFAFDRSGAGRSPGITELGGRVEFQFIPDSEL